MRIIVPASQSWVDAAAEHGKVVTHGSIVRPQSKIDYCAQLLAARTTAPISASPKSLGNLRHVFAELFHKLVVVKHGVLQVICKRSPNISIDSFQFAVRVDESSHCRLNMAGARWHEAALGFINILFE